MDGKYITVFTDPGRMKDKPFVFAENIYTFSPGDSIMVKAYKDEFYLVALVVQGKTYKEGYVREGRNYFDESDRFIRYRDSLGRVKKDSIANAFLDRMKREEMERQRKEENYNRILDSINREDSIQAEIDKKKCQYTQIEVDQFTGKLRKRTEIYDVYKDDKSRLVIQLVNFEGLRYLIFSTNIDLGCVSPYSNKRSTAFVKLESGQIVKFYHSGDIDCSGYELKGRITTGEMKILQESRVQSIRLEGTEYYHDFEVIDYPEIFKDKIKCIK